jgi:Flp pilus assembly protein TadD
LKDRGDLKGAILEYRELQRLIPNDVAASLVLGSALLDSHQTDAAIVEFRNYCASPQFCPALK